MGTLLPGYKWIQVRAGRRGYKKIWIQTPIESRFALNYTEENREQWKERYKVQKKERVEKDMRDGEVRYYNQYLASDVWRIRKSQYIVSVGCKCEWCGSRINLEVHHNCYHRLGREWDRDLKCLCKPCHEQAHIRILIKKGRVPKGWSDKKIWDILEEYYNGNVVKVVRHKVWRKRRPKAKEIKDKFKTVLENIRLKKYKENVVVKRREK